MKRDSFEKNKKTIPATFTTHGIRKFSFIDLFAGIGGFRLALQQLGGECVFSSEWDKYAQDIYELNYGERPYGDITLEEVKNKIPPSFDMLCAGFPCQAFSIAGKRKGFEDTRGTMFFEIATIVKKHLPKIVLLENVKGLTTHCKGKTLELMLKTLRDDLGYYVPDPKIINAKYFGVPQSRERVFIAGFRKDLGIDNFDYPRNNEIRTTVRSIIEKECVDSKYYLSSQYLRSLEEHKKRHERKGNGFGYNILEIDGLSNAIVTGGMGKERNLIIDNRLSPNAPLNRRRQTEINNRLIRRLTPREWANLQGFPEKFKMNIVSDTQLYKQFGNSVAIPVVQAMAESVLKKASLA